MAKTMDLKNFSIFFQNVKYLPHLLIPGFSWIAPTNKASGQFVQSDALLGKCYWAESLKLLADRQALGLSH